MLINLACLSVFLVILPSVENFLLGNSNAKIGVNLGSGGILGGLLGGFLGGSGQSNSLQDAIDQLLGLTNSGCKNFPCQHTCTSSGSNKYTCSCEPNFKVNASDTTRCVPNVFCTINLDGTIKGVLPPAAVNPATLPPITGVGNVKPCTSGGRIDLFAVIDSSGSITRPLYPNSFTFLLNLIAAFTVGLNDLQVGALLFSSNVAPLFDFSAHASLTDIRKAFQNPIYLNAQTHTWKALDFLVTKNVFSVKNGGRPDAVKIVIVITDGQSQDTAKTIASANKLKATGVIVIVIAVGTNVDMGEIKGVATSTADVFQCNGYNALASIVAQVTLRACNLKLGLGVSVNAKVTG